MKRIYIRVYLYECKTCRKICGFSVFDSLVIHIVAERDDYEMLSVSLFVPEVLSSEE
jgi:hypothetical protein